jgi:hypothetical protein
MKLFAKFLQVRVVPVPSSQLSLSGLPSQELPRRFLFAEMVPYKEEQLADTLRAAICHTRD